MGKQRKSNAYHRIIAALLEVFIERKVCGYALVVGRFEIAEKQRARCHGEPHKVRQPRSTLVARLLKYFFFARSSYVFSITCIALTA